MRHTSLAAGLAVLIVVLAAVPAEAQRRHVRRGPVAVRPVIYPSFYSPYHFGFGAWYPPYPVFGYPGPGFFPHDSAVSLRLQVTPREALVYVDGYAAGEVDDFDGVFQRLRLIPGHHEIVVYHPGHRTLRQNLYFNPGSTHTIRHTLEPLAPGEPEEPQPVPRTLPPPGAPPLPGTPPGAGPDVPSDTGTIALRVQPVDALVLVDGERWQGAQGSERLSIELPAGPHRLRVEKPGLRPFAVVVEVRPGETTALNISLSE